ncbi:MAG: substrate-binding domain-containing protein [Clostridiales bacterium]|nr:substrate-binding domain-containing protein [Clostridiales bacterium]
MKKKRIATMMLSAVLAIGCLAGCGGGAQNTASNATGNADTKNSGTEVTSDFDKTSPISVVSREDGSGTRGAFVELFGIEQKDGDGNKIDYTTDEAIVTNSTSVMMTTVAGDAAGIGYVSLGSLDDSVKALKIDGAEATVDNIKSGTYKISRPFNIVTKGEVSDVAQDFIDYIMSADGQAVIEENGYISVSDAPAYSGSKPSGKIVVAGSSSVTPVMEKLKEAYLAVNTNADIEVQESDSTTGVTSTIDGICDIGMASRDLADSESAEGITAKAIALDGIAVVVNKENPLENITKDDVMKIYMGDITTWDEVSE